jgi:hypothetical protein
MPHDLPALEKRPGNETFIPTLAAIVTWPGFCLQEAFGLEGGNSPLGADGMRDQDRR